MNAAVRLADDGGLDAVSIRKVAAHLGVGPMRLYTHVPTKTDLLDLMAESVYADMLDGFEHVSGESDWRRRLHRYAAAFRQAAFAHDWFVDLLSGRPQLGPAALAVLEAMAAAVQDGAGLRQAETTRHALGVINAYLIGATRADVVEQRLSAADGVAAADWEAAARSHLRSVFEQGDFPVLEQLAFAHPHSDSDGEKEFTWGLDVVLDGITRRSET